MRIELVSALARAAGLGGMVGGQMLDLAAEGRFAGSGATARRDEVRMLQAMKTGALLRFACEAGGMLGAATPAQRKALERYGSAVGQAFQIADDLLDLEGDPALVGKRPAKTRSPARRPWSACSASPAPRRGCASWSPRRKRRSRRSAQTPPS